MTRRGRQIGLAVGILALLVSSACSQPDGDPDAGDTGPTSDVADADAADGTEATDVSGDLTLDMGRATDGGESYEPYADGDAEIQLIHGFQGGYHVEPALYVTGIDESEFTTTLEYRVVRITDGEQLNRRETYNIDQYGWLEYRDGHLHHSNPVVFKTRNPDDVLGDEVRMTVTVDLEGGGQVTGTQTGTLVDGGRP